MKVLFVNPFQVRLVNKKGRVYNRSWLPLDLANCAAILEKEGIEAAIVDANAEQIGPEEVARRAQGFDKVFVTSTSLDRWQCPFLDIDPFFDNVAVLREAGLSVYVMGSHGTVLPKEVLEKTCAEAVLRGEPENTVLQICRSASLEEVDGVTYRNKEGEIINRPDQKPVDMNTFPIPAFHLLPMELYHYEVMGDRFALFEMSRGCASKCPFCLLKPYGKGVRRKGVDQLIAEVEYAIEKFGVRTAYFMDLEFTFLRKQVIEFCRYLAEKKYEFRWCCQTRLDLVDEELLWEMKRAGCTLIHFGVEAGSDERLEVIGKGIDKKTIREGMEIVKKVGIDTACFFMMGFPDSDKKDMEDILRFAIELGPDYPLFHMVAPYPGTKLYEEVKVSSTAHFSDDSLFPEAITGKLSLEELRTLTRQAYLRYYLRPSYILSRLKNGRFGVLRNQVQLFWSFVRS